MKRYTKLPGESIANKVFYLSSLGSGISDPKSFLLKIRCTVHRTGKAKSNQARKVSAAIIHGDGLLRSMDKRIKGTKMKFAAYFSNLNKFIGSLKFHI